jgi:hypothetical protein
MEEKRDTPRTVQMRKDHTIPAITMEMEEIVLTATNVQTTMVIVREGIAITVRVITETTVGTIITTILRGIIRIIIVITKWERASSSLTEKARDLVIRSKTIARADIITGGIIIVEDIIRIASNRVGIIRCSAARSASNMSCRRWIRMNRFV